MTNTLLFSIIIPHYNDLDGLKNCLEGIFQLDFPTTEFEVIIVDDCSSVKVDTFLQSAFPMVRFFRQPKNYGPGSARNRGVAEANGKYIAFIDSDAWPGKSWLTRYAEEFAKGCEIACGPVWHEQNFLARLTAITAFGEYLECHDGYRQHCPSVNFAITAPLMKNVLYDPTIQFAGEDIVLSTQLRLAGHKIRYLAGAWVMHQPHLTLTQFHRRAFSYGVGFNVSRSRCPELAGSRLHHYLKGGCALPLFAIRSGLDIIRLIRLRHCLAIKPFSFPLFIAGIIWTRLVYAIGVGFGYLPRRTK